MDSSNDDPREVASVYTEPPLERSRSPIESGELTINPSRFSNGTPPSSPALRNFVRFSIVGSAVPAATLACFGLASPRLGNAVGARQSGLLYATYTLTALTGATGTVQAWGSKHALLLGMALMNGYVGCFLGATLVPAEWVPALAYWGAVVGGVGAGIFWTAQGTYFASIAHHVTTDHSTTTTSWLAGWFATALLFEEALLEGLSTVLVRHWNVSWRAVFAVYATVAVSASLAARHLFDYDNGSSDSTSQSSSCSKATAALHLLLRDSKTKYLCGLPAVFGLAGGFVNSFVSGEVVPLALASPIFTNATTPTVEGTSSSSGAADVWVGLLVALHGLAAAGASWLLALIERSSEMASASSTCESDRLDGQDCARPPHRDVPLRDIGILVLGCWAFGLVGACFVQQPHPADWTWRRLVTVYVLQGVGRATFEATLKAVVAQSYTSDDREGAFANLVGHNGFWSCAAYFASVHLSCSLPSTGPGPTAAQSHCWQYRDGSWHNVGVLAWFLVVGAAAASVGYVRAWHLIRRDTAAPPTSGRRSSTHALRPHRPADSTPTYHAVGVVDECDAGTELREIT